MGTAHLSLRIRSQPGKDTRAPQICHPGVEFVSEYNGKGHAFLCLVSGIAEHQTLEQDSCLRTFSKTQILFGASTVTQCLSHTQNAVIFGILEEDIAYVCHQQSQAPTTLPDIAAR